MNILEWLGYNGFWLLSGGVFCIVFAPPLWIIAYYLKRYVEVWERLG